MNLKDQYTANQSFPLHRQRAIVDFEKGDAIVICGFKDDAVSFSVPAYGIVCAMTEKEFGQYFDAVKPVTANSFVIDMGVDQGTAITDCHVEVDGVVIDKVETHPPVPKVKPVGKKKKGRKKR